ncbi:hypothetical protein [Desulfovirgula thermocuniculi]|uniref:hypothetical protein n=1 Tax=Desulfovirgula thermocuniculi TaxID=348842 RepID=UPI00146FA9DA|nr:hypothetical protein [Desulfovirgula thermocuniculi]
MMLVTWVTPKIFRREKRMQTFPSHKAIRVAEASIETAEVKVEVVRLGKKQMTLAVFRQIEVEDLLDPKTAELRGRVWGRVNYHVGYEHAPSSPHLHILWQKGDELRHGVVFKEPEKGSNYYRNVQAVTVTLERFSETLKQLINQLS